MSLPAIIISLALFIVTLAVNLEVPLYPTYAENAGYGTGLTAVVFAFYIVGLLPVLMLFSGISDRLGRKPILLLGLACAFSATLLVTLFPTMQALLVARVLQGVGVGLSVGTGTAYLAEVLERTNVLEQEGAARAAALTAVTTSLGFGGGALITSAALWLNSSPVPSSYILTLILSAATLLAVAFLPNPPALGGAIMRLPAFPQGSLKLGLAIATAWAVTGLVISVVPAQLRLYGLAVWAGPALFLVNGTGAFVQPWVRRMDATQALLIGFVLLPLGYALLILGVWQGVLALVLLGASVAGAACYGFTYLGGLASISLLSGAQRARAVSGYFLFAYLGFGLPSIMIGFLAERTGVPAALTVFLGLVIVMCAVLAQRVRKERSKV